MEKYLWLIVFNILLVRANSFAVSSSSQYAVANQDFILTCTTTYVPTIGIKWTRNGADVVYMQLNSNECRYVDAGEGLSSNYRYNCTDNKTYTLIIPAERIQQEDGSKWQCKDSAGDNINKSSAPYTLPLARPPTSDPVVIGYSGTILYPSNTLKVTCSVQGTPLATISWTCKRISVTGADESTTTAAISEMTVNIDSSYNEQVCVCKAKHLSWITDKTAESQHFVVYFAPDTAPVISGYRNNQIIYEPENKDLTCRVTGGNPLATITWTCRDLSVIGINQSVEGEARSTITVGINRDYNNKQCICRATHLADNYNKHTNVTFTVYCLCP